MERLPESGHGVRRAVRAGGRIRQDRRVELISGHDKTRVAHGDPP